MLGISKDLEVERFQGVGKELFKIALHSLQSCCLAGISWSIIGERVQGTRGWGVCSVPAGNGRDGKPSLLWLRERILVLHKFKLFHPHPRVNILLW